MARFDRMARRYERWNPYPHGDALEENLAPRPGDTILDVGGGTGQALAPYEGRVARLVVADPSRGMHEERRRLRSRVDGALAAGEALPFRDASVDRIVMVDALHHVPDQKRCVSELRRVLKADGRAVIEEFRWDRWWVRLFLGLAEKLVRFRSHFHRPENWRVLFEGAGFQVEERIVSKRDVQFVLTPRAR